MDPDHLCFGVSGPRGPFMTTYVIPPDHLWLDHLCGDSTTTNYISKNVHVSRVQATIATMLYHLGTHHKGVSHTYLL